MHKNRLEAFSDGVVAILITIMVLDLKIPQGTDLAALRPLAGFFSSYVLSFVFLGIYWNNHHHLLQAATHVNGRVLWANLHLLFWLSLVPFLTGWMAASSFQALPVGLYGCVLLMAAIAYFILSVTLIHSHGHGSALGQAIGGDFKGKISVVIYAAAIALCGFSTIAALALYVLVAVLWLIPDQRIEKRMGT